MPSNLQLRHQRGLTTPPSQPVWHSHNYPPRAPWDPPPPPEVGRPPDLDRAVLGAGGEAEAAVGEAEVQHRLRVLPQALHLQAGDGVAEPTELPEPGGGGWSGKGGRFTQPPKAGPEARLPGPDGGGGAAPSHRTAAKAGRANARRDPPVRPPPPRPPPPRAGFRSLPLPPAAPSLPPGVGRGFGGGPPAHLGAAGRGGRRRSAGRRAASRAPRRCPRGATAGTPAPRPAGPAAAGGGRSRRGGSPGAWPPRAGRLPPRAAPSRPRTSSLPSGGPRPERAYGSRQGDAPLRHPPRAPLWPGKTSGARSGPRLLGQQRARRGA